MKDAETLLGIGPVKYTSEVVERKIQQSVVDREPFELLMQKKVAYFQAARYEQAVEVCIQLVAQARHIRPRPGLNAMCLHSLGSALHQLGFHQAAGRYYQLGLVEFELDAKSWCNCCSKQNTQLRYMKERAEMNARGFIPAAGSYCSESGEVAFWTEQEVGQALERIAAFDSAGSKAGSEASLYQTHEAMGIRPGYAKGVYRSLTGLVSGTTQMVSTTLKGTTQVARQVAEAGGDMMGCASPRPKPHTARTAHEEML
jgi:tetratricopeptide (TPR) repeat protein